MEHDQATQNAPEVSCVLELNPSLGRVTVAGDAVHDEVCSKVLQDVTNVFTSLGIPGSPTLQIVPFQGSFADDELLRLTIHDRLCPFPHEVLIPVWNILVGSPWGNETAENMLSQLQGVTDATDERLIQIYYDLLGYACTEIIARRPSVLLALPQVEYYLEQLKPLVEDASLTFDAPQLAPILHAVLDCKVSIKNAADVAQLLLSKQERSQEVLTEELIETLLTVSDVQDVLIILSREYLRHLTTLDIQEGPGKFVTLRNGLWETTGIVYPSLRFVVDDKCPSPRYVFCIHHLLTMPWIGLTEASEQGNELEYFLLCLAYVLQENSHCFVNRQFVQEQLQRQKDVYPALIDAVYAKGITLEHITHVLRALALERYSIKDLRLILERLLDYTYLADDPAGNAALDWSFTMSGNSDSDWFRDPMHAVDYAKGMLPRYPD
jgi:hypothetical protein